MNRTNMAILLARPMDQSDPLLTRAADGYAVDTVLGELLRLGVFDEVVISVPEETPEAIREALSGMKHAKTAVSRHSTPQTRLLRHMERHELASVTVLTSYSVLMDAAAIRSGQEAVRADHADLYHPGDVIAPKFFTVLNRRTAELLHESHRTPLPPFVFAQKARQFAELRIEAEQNMESPRERFLWELLFAGERNAVPQGVAEAFLSKFTGSDRLARESFDTFIQQRYGLHSPELLDKALRLMSPYDPSLRTAMQINQARRLCAHLPEHRGASLEVGHGKTPLTSLLLAHVFDEVHGADVYKHSEQGYADSLDFLRLLGESGMAPLSGDAVRYEADALDKRSRFFHGELQAMPLAPESIDFCHSRMVLEHVMDMPGLAAYLRRTMRPDGVMLHEIGLQDHGDLSHINFEFLSHEPRQWQAMKRGTNLWRINDIAEMFASEGFDVSVIERDVRLVPPRSLHEHWKNYRDEDLYCYRAVLKAVR